MLFDEISPRKRRLLSRPTFKRLYSLCTCVCVSSFPLCIVKFVDENLWLTLAIGKNVCAPGVFVAKHLFLFVLVGLLVRLLIMCHTKYPLMNSVSCILGLYFVTSMVLHRALLCKFFLMHALQFFFFYVLQLLCSHLNFELNTSQ